MPNNHPKTVEEYIKAQPAFTQPHLNELRKLIKSVLPDAKEGLKWNQPAYWEKTILVQFAGFTDHLNLYPTPSTIEKLKPKLTNYKTGTSSVQFPYDKPLPVNLIKEIVTCRLKEYREDGVKWM